MAEDPRELQGFYDETVAKLAAYDEQYETELVRTLETFLDADGNVAKTSEKLFTHRHTIRYRLERVKELTDLDVSSTDGRERLSLGLKAMRVLGIVPPRRPSPRKGQRSRPRAEPTQGPLAAQRRWYRRQALLGGGVIGGPQALALRIPVRIRAPQLISVRCVANICSLWLLRSQVFGGRGEGGHRALDVVRGGASLAGHVRGRRRHRDPPEVGRSAGESPRIISTLYGAAAVSCDAGK